MGKVVKGYRLPEECIKVINSFKIGNNETQKLISILNVFGTCFFEAHEDIAHLFTNEEIEALKTIKLNNIAQKTPTELRASITKQIEDDSIKEKVIKLNSFDVFTLSYIITANM